MICPKCNGEGSYEVTGHFRTTTGGFFGTRRLRCGRCNTIGRVDDEMKVWIEQGKELLHERQEMDVSISEIARSLGVTRYQVSRWETGKDKPPVDQYIGVLRGGHGSEA